VRQAERAPLFNVIERLWRLAWILAFEPIEGYAEIPNCFASSVPVIRFCFIEKLFLTLRSKRASKETWVRRILEFHFTNEAATRSFLEDMGMVED